MPKHELVRGLSLRDTIALVVGTIIGTGVFLKTARMAQAVGSPSWVLLAWLVAGLLSFAGALTYAELGAMMPHAGGEFVYLRAAYGPLPAFLFGWMRLAIGAAGSIAIFGVAFATFLSALIPLPAVWMEKTFQFFGQSFHWQFGSKQVAALLVILFFSAINCLRVVFGGRVQTLLTAAKVAAILAIVIGAFFYAPSATWSNFHSPQQAGSWPGFSPFGAALIAALWAFDGWNNMPMVAGEVKDPNRNIPLALLTGTFLVLVIYGLVNVAYFYALPLEEIVTSSSAAHPDALPVATKAAQSFLGSAGGRLVSIGFILSTIGALHGSILTNARITFAMSRDGVFFKQFGELNPKTSVPMRAMILQAIWACVLAVSGTFDQLTDCVIFASWIFYASTASAVFVLRRKMPDAPRPYRTFGYPLVPLLFIAVAGWLIINTLFTNPIESAVGTFLILLGLPVYFLNRSRLSWSTR